MRRSLWAALTGVVAAATVLAVAEVVALFVGAESSPLFAVGSLVIDLAPPGVKDLTIALFGTGDKAALLTVLGIVIAAFAAAAGYLEYRRKPVGTIILVAFSAVGVIAVVTRANASGISAVPTVVGMLAGVVVLNTLQQRLRRWNLRAGDSSAPKPAPLERRQFLSWMLVAAAASAIVGVGARAMNAGAAVVTAARNALVLPTPATAAPALASGTELGITNLSPLVTPAADFYRIDTALQVPQLNPDTWSLKIVGMVENEVEISFADLLALPLVENYTTLACVSNEVGGDLIGNALWLGHPIRDLLARAKPLAGADMVLSRSSDGFTAGTPLEVLQDAGRESLLAVGMNGAPLPVEHGFPVRMVVPGLYGYVSATKWVVELKVTTFAEDLGYWTPRGWNALGPVKTSSRIDTPRPNAGLAAGTIPIAGVAWSQHTGIAKVEVQIDNGAWQQATLADAISADTWRQWVLQWDAPSGDHTIAVRATDASSYTQTSDQAPPAPDGSTGWHTVKITVQ